MHSLSVLLCHVETNSSALASFNDATRGMLRNSRQTAGQGRDNRQRRRLITKRRMWDVVRHSKVTLTIMTTAKSCSWTTTTSGLRRGRRRWWRTRAARTSCDPGSVLVPAFPGSRAVSSLNDSISLKSTTISATHAILNRARVAQVTK